MHPMSTFDPIRSRTVHDRLNDSWDDWEPADAEHFCSWAAPQDSQTPHVIQYDGRLLEGWKLT
jgi:hypothetical protein